MIRSEVQKFRFLIMIFSFFLLFVLAAKNMEIFPVIANNTTKKVLVRTDGTLTINQKPFFPLGLYHVSWDISKEKQIKHLQEISDVGFNIIHASAPNWDDYEKFLDKANQLGIYVISEENSGALVNFVNRFKNKPAVLGWKLADDVDIYKNGKGFIPSEILDLHYKIKKADPDHITYIAGAIDKRIFEFVNTADAIGATAYPVGHQEGQPIGWAYHMVSIVRDFALEKHLITAALQAFRWPRKDAPIPSAPEIRNLTYQSILAGAKGIIYYTYYDETWKLADHPALWNAIKSIIPEIKTIEPFLLNGKFIKQDTGIKTVKSSLWIFQDQALLIVANMSYSKEKNVLIEIPKGFKKSSNLFEHESSQSSKLIANRNRIYGSMDPLDVSVFKFVH
jgi:hypothetical protein